MVSFRQRRHDDSTRHRIWVQHVDVEADILKMRVKAAQARGLEPWQEEVARGVLSHLERARQAANREDPQPRRFRNWWRGTLAEAAYRHLHAARAQMVDLLDESEIPAETHGAVARAELALPRGDPRLLAMQGLKGASSAQLRPFLRRLMDDSYQALDGKHAQLRSFRNILLVTAVAVFVLVALTMAVVSWQPSWVPLCSPADAVTGLDSAGATAESQNCPTSSASTGPSSGDVLVVALLGALGGAFTAAISIRNLKGTSTPYDVPVALATLKFPLGAFTAILALVAIQGDFVPGLSVLDSQQQILAYALIFGSSQQLLTRLLDKRAQTLLEDLPGGTGTEPAQTPASVGDLLEWRPRQSNQAAGNGQVRSAADSADLPGEDLEVLSSDEPIVGGALEDEEFHPVAGEDQVLDPDPLSDQGDDFQDEPVEDSSAADLEAELPDVDIEVVTNDEPALEHDVQDEEFKAVVAKDEVAEPDLLTDQGDEFQDDEAAAQDIAPADAFSVVSSDQRG